MSVLVPPLVLASQRLMPPPPPCVLVLPINLSRSRLVHLRITARVQLQTRSYPRLSLGTRELKVATCEQPRHSMLQRSRIWLSTRTVIGTPRLPLGAGRLPCACMPSWHNDALSLRGGSGHAFDE